MMYKNTLTHTIGNHIIFRLAFLGHILSQNVLKLQFKYIDCETGM